MFKFTPKSDIECWILRQNQTFKCLTLLFPTLYFVGNVGHHRLLEDRLFDTGFLLLTVVFQQAESVSAQQNDGNEIAHREECHTEIAYHPDKVEAHQRTEHDHHTGRGYAIGGHDGIAFREETDVCLAIIVVADDAGEGKEEDCDSYKDLL